jgi:hypothetical protein
MFFFVLSTLHFEHYDIVIAVCNGQDMFLIPQDNSGNQTITGIFQRGLAVCTDRLENMDLMSDLNQVYEGEISSTTPYNVALDDEQQ